MNYAALSDPDLIAERTRIRGELERFPEHSDMWMRFKILYAMATSELDSRARAAWSA